MVSRRSHGTVASGSSRPNETGMTLLLVSVMALIGTQLLFALPLSLGPGLSAENALLYVVAGALAFRIAVQRDFRFELRELHAAFGLLIAYAAISILAATLLVQYPSYRPLKAVIGLKARLVDQFVFFAVFFYGVRNSRSAFTVIKWLLVLTIGINLVALMDAWGMLEARGLVDRDDGRIQGVMGESNQSAAMIASFLPALTTCALMAFGVRRVAWLVGVTICVGAMIISASRGALVAIFLGALWGMVCFRRYASPRVVAAAVGLVVFVAVIVVSVITARFGGLLLNRFVADTTDTDMVSVSSGRLDIWSNALAAMADAPLTFITGFGWYVYDAMPFRLAPHNHYLALWFDLGLVGLICGTTLLVLVVRTAMRAVPLAAPQYRPTLIAFSIGAVTISIATFFVDLYSPWLWFWAYAGLTMRIAVNARAAAATQTAPAESQSGPAISRNPFGWVGAARQ